MKTIPIEMQVDDWWKVAELAVSMATAVPELARLRSISSELDGFGAGGGNRGGPGTVANPTLATTLKAAGGKVEGDLAGGVEVQEPTPDTWLAAGEDRVATLLELLDRETAALVNSARRVAGIRRLIEGRGDARVGRQSSLQADCLACECPVTGVGDDRLRSGYCPACHRAWLRFAVAEAGAGRDPVHEVFRRLRRASIASSQRKDRAS